MLDADRHDITDTWAELAQPGGRIVYLVLDGAGGLPAQESQLTELASARTPNLDALARASSCGMLEMVGPGITPGSGPGHLALFGYDPLRYRIGRGVLSALGVDFDLQRGDIAARVNFATRDAQGTVTDRRAGRIATDTNRALCKELGRAISLPFAGEYFIESVSEHRAVLVLRGEGLAGNLTDTDPQTTDRPPLPVEARTPDSRRTAELVASFLSQAHDVLAGQERANTLLLRGFEQYEPLPTLATRFGLCGLCIARYPMYRGVSRLLGMEAITPANGPEATVGALAERYGDDYDLYFAHFKDTDSRGEDGDFNAKVAAIEAIDEALGPIRALDPDVLVITCDHSTPATLATHSWHPVPVLLRSPSARPDDAERFTEAECRRGELGLRPGLHLLGLALGHAHRLRKFGA